MTNGDRIRRMSDEELAGILHCNQCIYLGMPECEPPDCAYGIMTWLKQEVGEEVGTDSQTIEPEVRHGRWIECCNELNKKCSCCDEVYGTIYENEPFCPNCGARMDKIDTSVDGKGEFK